MNVDPGHNLEPQTRAFYCRALDTLQAAGAPFVVGGAYAFGAYTGIERHTKDFDIFVRRQDYEKVMELLAADGCTIELTFPHWLGKALSGDDCIDVIFSSGSGIAAVDDEWFTHAIDGNVLGQTTKLCPAEEMIWSKAFVMERERYDGADVAHLLRAQADQLDWKRLLRRFGPHWRVLFSYLTLFGYIYPAEQARVPAWVIDDLLGRMKDELAGPAPVERICQGTYLSRAQFLIDVEQWGYQDARLSLNGTMSIKDVAHWTASIYTNP